MAARRTRARTSFVVRLCTWVYAGLIRVAYPARFRATYGRDMREMFHDRCAARVRRMGVLGLPGMWARTLTDVARHGAAERHDGLLGHGPRRAGIIGTDIRFAYRSLRKDPGFTVVALTTLALGIGATTAVFSVIDAALLADLPFSNAEELFMVWRYDASDSRDANFSYPDIADIRTSAASFEALAPFEGRWMVVADGVDGRRVAGTRVTADFFDVMGVQPALGRAIRPGDEAPGAEPVVVLGHALWRTRFGGDPGIVGRLIRVDSRPATVVGVMPKPFSFPPRVEVWTPLPSDDERGWSHLMAIGRLAPGRTVEQAEAEVGAIIARLGEEYPDRYTNSSAHLIGLREQFNEDLRSTLVVLVLAVGAVLLIGCANIANLLLARSSARGREIAIRAALGASRSRVVRQLLTESLALSLVGGSAGVVIALWGTQLLSRLAPTGVVGWQASVDTRMLAYSLGVSLATVPLFGLWPALTGSTVDANASLRGGGRDSTAGRRVLIVAEVGLAVVLLVGAGLMVRTMSALLAVDVGFEPDDVWVLDVELPIDSDAPDYDPEVADARVVSFFRGLERRIAGLPGVVGTGQVAFLPFGGGSWGSRTMVEGQPVVPRPERYLGRWNVVTPGYFDTMGVSLLEGRVFDDSDTTQSEGVAVINETLARTLWPGGDPIGARITNQEPGTDLWLTVVGIVGDVRGDDLVSEPVGEIYQVHSQLPWNGMQVVVKSAIGAAIADPIRSAIAELEPGLAIAELRPMTGFIERYRSQARFLMRLLGAFSAVAMALASIGIYGVVSYGVNERRPELGVRRALGARAGDVAGLLLRSGAALAGAGIAIGLVAAWAVGAVLEGLLFDVGATDPLTYASAAALAFLAALTACLIPALRAARIDPVVALRHEH